MVHAILILLPLLPQVKLSGREPTYDLTLPHGYEEDKTRARRFLRSVGPEEWARLRIYVEVAEKALPQPPTQGAALLAADVLPLARLPDSARFQFQAQPWGDHQRGSLEYRYVYENLQTFALRTVFPLDGKALILSVEGPEPFEKEVRRDMDLLLTAFKGTCPWITPAELQKRRIAGWLDIGGLGLVGLYLLVWAMAFRGNFMMFHGLRTIWLLLAGAVLMAPLGLKPGFEMFQLPLNIALPLALFGLAGRRVKLAIELS